MQRMHEAAPSDEELMRRFGGGDAAAFETLYRRHELRVFHYLHRNLRNRASANDLMQDIWFSVARNAVQYQPTARFTTWLYTLAHNRMIDFFRSARPQLSLDAVVSDSGSEGGGAAAGGVPAALVADPRAEPQAAVAADDGAAALLAAVEQLPAEQRDAFLMQAEGELSVADIAAATGASFETVKSRLRYARAKLRQLLWEYA
jgi:RNA polymerase sigma-70 factor (ECF subfamily)